jgi:hypothetical protein
MAAGTESNRFIIDRIANIQADQFHRHNPQHTNTTQSLTLLGNFSTTWSQNNLFPKQPASHLWLHVQREKYFAKFVCHVFEELMEIEQLEEVLHNNNILNRHGVE